MLLLFGFMLIKALRCWLRAGAIYQHCLDGPGSALPASKGSINEDPTAPADRLNLTIQLALAVEKLRIPK